MKRWVVLLALALVASVIHVQIAMSPLGDKVESLALDLWFNIRGNVSSPNNVVIVAKSVLTVWFLDGRHSSLPDTVQRGAVGLLELALLGEPNVEDTATPDIESKGQTATLNPDLSGLDIIKQSQEAMSP